VRTPQSHSVSTNIPRKWGRINATRSVLLFHSLWSPCSVCWLTFIFSGQVFCLKSWRLHLSPQDLRRTCSEWTRGVLSCCTACSTYTYSIIRGEGGGGGLAYRVSDHREGKGRGETARMSLPSQLERTPQLGS
jgi:hypothetical protein